MPTLPLFASESALAVSSSLLSVFSVTSPVPALTVAPAGTIASVWFETMLIATEPASESVLESPPAPDSASAAMSCSASRKRSPETGAGLSGSAVPSPRNVHAEPFHL